MADVLICFQVRETGWTQFGPIIRAKEKGCARLPIEAQQVKKDMFDTLPRILRNMNKNALIMVADHPETPCIVEAGQSCLINV